jgi:dolichol-phosphate mannosyltransferase
MPRIVWLVLPTYNEAENLEPVLAAVTAELARTGDEYRVLIVDDSSPDGTGELADRIAAGNRFVEVLHRTQREGLGAAYVNGFHVALERGADLVLQMDADFSHDPADIGRLLAAIDAGADLALGSRYTAGGGTTDWGLARRMISRNACLYARVILSLPIRDLTGGFKCFRREVLEAIDLDTVRSHGYVFQVEVTLRAVRRGFTVVEVPIIFRDREHGASKMSVPIALEAAWRLPQLRFKRASR